MCKLAFKNKVLLFSSTVQERNNYIFTFFVRAYNQYVFHTSATRYTLADWLVVAGLGRLSGAKKIGEGERG